MKQITIQVTVLNKMYPEMKKIKSQRLTDEDRYQVGSAPLCRALPANYPAASCVLGLHCVWGDGGEGGSPAEPV